MTLHVVQFSGGIESWAATMRVIAQHGTRDLVLLTADTRAEDPDLWRFVHDATSQIGVPPTIVADGRDPFEVFADVRFLGNSRLAPCSHHLKQIPCRRWLETHADPADTILYIGILPKEQRRVPAIARGWRPWKTRFPMIDSPPHLTKDEVFSQARKAGLKLPRLYELGFPHNNCFGACVRAGKRQWVHLLNALPEQFTAAERKEAEFREQHGDYAILRERSAGGSRPLPLSELRRRIQAA